MGGFVSWVRGRFEAFEIPLIVVTFALGVYLAVGSILSAAMFPDKKTWVPWKGWFIALLAAAVWVPIYALYQTVEARLHASAQKKTQAALDLSLACQQIVGAIADACGDVAVNDVAACVWKCGSDGRFGEIARFYLPQQRPPSGVDWRKGRGVAGWAWEVNVDLRADLRPLIHVLDQLGSAAFDALPTNERYGLSAADLDATRQFTGVCAIRLFSTDTRPELLGMLILDYVGPAGFDCIAQQAARRPVTIYIGACAQVLTEAYTKL